MGTTDFEGGLVLEGVEKNPWHIRGSTGALDMNIPTID
jgi:hypothetical protein